MDGWHAFDRIHTSVIVCFSPGQPILLHQSETVYRILDGEAEVHKVFRHGRSRKIGSMKGGDESWSICGEIESLDKQNLELVVIAHSKCRVQIFSSSSLVKILQASPIFSAKFYQMACSYYSELLANYVANDGEIEDRFGMQLTIQNEPLIFLPSKPLKKKPKGTIVSKKRHDSREKNTFCFSSSFLAFPSPSDLCTSESVDLGDVAEVVHFSKLEGIALEKKEICLSWGNRKVSIHTCDPCVAQFIEFQRSLFGSENYGKKNFVPTPGLSDFDLRSLKQCGSTRSYEKGVFLSCEDFQDSEIFIILEGTCVLFSQCISLVIHEGALIGSLDFLKIHFPFCLRTDERCVLLSLSPESVFSLCQKDNPFQTRLCQTILQTLLCFLLCCEDPRLSELKKSGEKFCPKCKEKEAIHLCSICHLYFCDDCKQETSILFPCYGGHTQHTFSSEISKSWPNINKTRKLAIKKLSSPSSSLSSGSVTPQHSPETYVSDPTPELLAIKLVSSRSPKKETKLRSSSADKIEDTNIRGAVKIKFRTNSDNKLEDSDIKSEKFSSQRSKSSQKLTPSKPKKSKPVTGFFESLVLKTSSQPAPLQMSPFHSNSPIRNRKKHSQSFSSLQREEEPEEGSIASLEDLIFRAVDGNISPNIFFLVFPCFASVFDVISQLKSVFDKNDTEKETRKKVIKVVQLWFEGGFHSFMDIFGCPRATAVLTDFILNIKKFDTTAGVKLNEALKENQIKMSEEEDRRATLFEETSLPFVPMSSIKWENYDDHWFAVTLTTYEYDLFLAISPKEFLLYSHGKKEECSNIHRSIAFFNALGSWVTTVIVQPVKLAERVQKLNKMISVANRLLELQNFSSSMAIVAGLNNVAIQKMKKTWQNLDVSQAEKFHGISQMMSHKGNYSKYRAHLKKSSLPIVPFLGVILADLTTIQDGNEDPEPGQINYTKWRMVGNVLENIVNFQSIPFKDDAPKLLLFIPALLHFEPLSDEKALEMSKIVDPEDSEETIQYLIDLIAEKDQQIASSTQEITQLKTLLSKHNIPIEPKN